MTESPHIIVVDDEAAAREMVGDYLRMHGFTVTLCDGAPGLRAEMAKQPADLIVLDLNMPQEDGLSVIRKLKQSGLSIVLVEQSPLLGVGPLRVGQRVVDARDAGGEQVSRGQVAG